MSQTLKYELYKVSSELKLALDELRGIDCMPEQVIKDTLEGMAGTLEQKAIEVVAYIKNLEAQAKAVKEAKLELASRQVVLEHKAAQLTKTLANILHSCEIKKVESDLYDIGVQLNPPKLVITNEDLIPPDYFDEETVIKLNTAKVKQALAENYKVPGAEISRSVGLRIR